MARKKSPVKRPRFKVQRRLLIELPGLGKPGAMERRPYPPGEHGQRRKKYSEYGLQLEEKQKLLNHYCLREEQLRRFIRQARKGQGTNWAEKLIGLLERRLDNLIFRLGWAPSIPAARQLVSHGKVLVNGRKADIPSMVIELGEEITLKPEVWTNPVFMQARQSPRLELADFLKVEEREGGFFARLTDVPKIDAIPFPFDSGLFTEFYSLKGI